MKSVLITGACRGLGRSLTKIFLENGYKVIACCRNKDNSMRHDNLMFLDLDLNNDESVSKVVDLVNNNKIKIDILINSAGVYLEKGLEHTAPSNIDLALIQKSMQINFYSPLKLMKSVCKVMKLNKSGKIINVSSAWGSYSLSKEIKDYGASFAYRVSKQSLNYLTLLIADELKDYESIEVNAVCPGWMKTDMGGENAQKKPSESAQEIFELATNDIGSGNFYKGKEISDW